MSGQIDRVLELERLQKNENKYFFKNVVAVLSGKGGTGKTFFTSNSAYLFSKNHGKVLLIDLDFNLSNTNLIFNKTANKTINLFLESSYTFNDIITEVLPNLDIIFGESGKLDKTKLTEYDVDRIFQCIKSLENKYDLVLIDLGAGASNEVLYAASKASLVSIVTTPEPPAIMDAYVITKMLTLNYNSTNIYSIINNCSSELEGIIAVENLSNAVRHFLKINIPCLALIPYSPEIRSSVMKQNIFVESFANHPITSMLQMALSKIIKNLQLFNIDHIGS